MTRVKYPLPQHTHVTQAIRRTHRALARTIAQLLERGQADGSVRRDLDPQAAAWWLLSLLASRCEPS